MADRLRVDLYCEDIGHEQFARAIAKRIAREEKLAMAMHTVCGRGGHGRALQEFRAWQANVRRDIDASGVPDLLVLMIDGNCSPWNEAVGRLEESIDQAVFPRAVVACPEPHLERWLFADRDAFRQVVGKAPPADPGKCERRLYKRLLRKALSDMLILTDDTEIAPDIVAAMDFYRAGKSQPSLRAFTDRLRAALRRAKAD